MVFALPHQAPDPTSGPHCPVWGGTTLRFYSKPPPPCEAPGLPTPHQNPSANRVLLECHLTPVRPAWYSGFLRTVPCATEWPLTPTALGLVSATPGAQAAYWATGGLLTWVGRAPGCRPPAAVGEAAPGTEYLAGSPRLCPPRGPGHSTGSSARRLPHSSRCRPPACTATWGKPVSGGHPRERASPHFPRLRAWRGSLTGCN